jgi:UDP-N-acetyl-D-glucosamine dehydrogenase
VPDLQYVTGTFETVAQHLRPGQLVVLESTTYPGTTRQVAKPILDRTGLRSEYDYFLAYSPEREDPGNPRFDTRSIPKVIGGDGPLALQLADMVYGRFLTQTVRVTSADVAEAVKLTENIFRSVNIALVNELKVVYEAMGIDIWEVIEAAKTKPFGYMPFYPGPGLGGHCIPVDPFYLTWKAREYDFTTEFIELAGKVNQSMPYYCRSLISQAMNHGAGKSLAGSKMLVLGVSYKPDIGDMRESPALKIIELIQNAGANVSYHDPYVPALSDLGLTSQPLDPKAYDAVVIVTDHSSIDYEQLVEDANLVIDLRNATRQPPNNKVWKL